jgi:hypothetical protein
MINKESHRTWKEAHDRSETVQREVGQRIDDAGQKLVEDQFKLQAADGVILSLLQVLGIDLHTAAARTRPSVR